MTKAEIKSVFGTITSLAQALCISSQAISQWFDENNEITNVFRKSAVIGAACRLGKTIPDSWVSNKLHF